MICVNVLQAICDRYPERKLVKKWVTDKVKEVAERTLTGWMIKSEAPVTLPETESNAFKEVSEADMSTVEEAEASVEPIPNPQSGALLKFLGKVGSRGPGTDRDICINYLCLAVGWVIQFQSWSLIHFALYFTILEWDCDSFIRVISEKLPRTCNL